MIAVAKVFKNYLKGRTTVNCPMVEITKDSSRLRGEKAVENIKRVKSVFDSRLRKG